MSYFKLEEFKCPCCSVANVKPELINKLDSLREECGFPLVVTSGYRCQSHQDALRKKGYETSKGISTHTLGIAADIRPAIMSADTMKILRLLAPKHFDAVGMARTFVHIDLRIGKQRRWHYSGYLGND